MNPLVVGHRGAPAYALENTLASFQQAVAMGADMLELDVRESRDGKFLVIHDRDLRRISPWKDIVDKTDSQVLRSRELNDKQHLLLLEEVFESLPPSIGMMVELKAVRDYRKVATFLNARAAERPVLLTSFDLSLIQRILEDTPTLPLGVVSSSVSNLVKARRMGIQVKTVCIDFQVLNPNTLEEIRRYHRNIFAWTVDRAEDLRRVVQLGVDGVISNKPDEVRRVLAEFG